MRDFAAALRSVTIYIVLFGSLLTWVALATQLWHRRPLIACEPRRRVPWNGWLVAGCTLLLLMTQTPFADPFWLAAGIVSGLFGIGTCVLLLRLAARADARDIGFTTARLPYDLWQGLLGFLAVVTPVYAIQALIFQYEPSEHPLIKFVKASPGWLPFFLCVVRAAVIAPLTEEFLFRVLLQGWLEARERRWRSRLVWLNWLPRGGLPILLSSTIFALAHLGHGWDPLPLFPLALGLGFLYFRTHRIWPSLTMHACLNGMAMLLLWCQIYDPQPTPGPLEEAPLGDVMSVPADSMRPLDLSKTRLYGYSVKRGLDLSHSLIREDNP